MQAAMPLARLSYAFAAVGSPVFMGCSIAIVGIGVSNNAGIVGGGAGGVGNGVSSIDGIVGGGGGRLCGGTAKAVAVNASGRERGNCAGGLGSIIGAAGGLGTGCVSVGAGDGFGVGDVSVGGVGIGVGASWVGEFVEAAGAGGLTGASSVGSAGAVVEVQPIASNTATTNRTLMIFFFLNAIVLPTHPCIIGLGCPF